MSRKKGVLQKIEERSGSFSFAFLVLFIITFGFLALVGATPDAPHSDLDIFADTVTGAVAATSTTGTSQPTSTNNTTTQTTGSQNSAMPTRIAIKKIGLDDIVSDPTDTDIDELDKELLKGAVRYPTSAPLGVNGTVLIFGHSSYLPIVHNQAYKEFDGIQNLKNGDIISVYSSDTEYQYSVTNVRVADATSDVVELPQDGKHLALVTCDSFATKSNRFVVTADLVGEYSYTP